MAFKNIEEADLKNRITKTLTSYPDKDMVALMWNGYVSGVYLYAVKSFSRADHKSVRPLLPKIGGEEEHVFLWHPDSPEERLEAIADYKRHQDIIAEREGRK